MKDIEHRSLWNDLCIKAVIQSGFSIATSDPILFVLYTYTYCHILYIPIVRSFKSPSNFTNKPLKFHWNPLTSHSNRMKFQSNPMSRLEIPLNTFKITHEILSKSHECPIKPYDVAHNGIEIPMSIPDPSVLGAATRAMNPAIIGRRSAETAAGSRSYHLCWFWWYGMNGIIWYMWLGWQIWYEPIWYHMIWSWESYVLDEPTSNMIGIAWSMMISCMPVLSIDLGIWSSYLLCLVVYPFFPPSDLRPQLSVDQSYLSHF